MTHRIENMRRLLGLTYDVLFSTLVVHFFQAVFFSVDINAVPFFVLLGVFVVSEVCAEKCSNIFTFVLPQLAVSVLMCFLPLDGGSRVVLCAAAVVKLLSSFGYVRNGMKPGKLDEAPWITAMTALVIYGFGRYLKINALADSAYVMLLVLLTLFFVRLYLQGLSGYVSSAKDVSGLPLSKIVSVNNVMVVGIILSFLMLATISGLFDFSIVGRFVLRGLKYVAVLIFYGMRYLVRFITGLLVGKGDITVEFEKTDWNDTEVLNEAGIFDDIIGYIIEFAIFAGCIYLVYSAVRKLIKSFMIKRIITTDVVESADKDETEGINGKKRCREKHGDDSMNARLRKAYRQGVKRYGGEIDLKSSYTCGDIEEKLENAIGKDRPGISEATSLYQQVRYGGVQADRGMVKDVSSAFKTK